MGRGAVSVTPVVVLDSLLACAGLWKCRFAFRLEFLAAVRTHVVALYATVTLPLNGRDAFPFVEEATEQAWDAVQ